ncbi:hypothetical protein LVJ94_20375 [Pendulispora rubella]|uniref:Uncharacterized protein n=1 Tax=Pendulispora rubella TaxID=2741070 RepID=A0ABZ2LFA1_9BACT
MAYVLVGRLSINVYSPSSPTDEEWDAYLKYRVQHMPRVDAVLVYTQGGASTIPQRERLNRMPPRVLGVLGAVVTSSVYVRAMYKARPETHALWRVFSETEWDGAFRHLGVRHEERSTVLATVTKLGVDLGLAMPLLPS